MIFVAKQFKQIDPRCQMLILTALEGIDYMSDVGFRK